MESVKEKAFSAFALWPFTLPPSSCLGRRHEAWRFSSQTVAMRQQCEFRVPVLGTVERKTGRARVHGVVYKPLHGPVTTRPRLTVV